MDILNKIPPTREMPTEVASVLWARIEREATTATGPAAPQHRRRWRLATAGSAVAAAGAAVVVLQPWAASPAFASWTAVPDQVDAGTLQTIGSECLTTQESHFPQARLLHPVLGEQRGHFKAVLLGGSSGLSACVDVPSGALGSMVNLGGAPAPAPIALDDNPGLMYGPDAFRVAYGRIAPNVAKVVVTTTDGLVVTASVGDGYFLAWWPGGASPRSVVAQDASSRSLGQVSLPGAGPSFGVPTHSPAPVG